MHISCTKPSNWKYLAIEILCIAQIEMVNHTIVLGFAEVSDGFSEKTSAAIDRFVKEVAGIKFLELVHSCMQDKAALRIADLLYRTRKGCDMHDLDTIARNSVGDLKRLTVIKYATYLPSVKISLPMRSHVLLTFPTAIF